jgi:hypothetical protein
MAMSISVTLNTGVVVNYFRISQIKITRPINGSEFAEISVDSFLTQDARMADDQPLNTNTYLCPQPDVTSAVAYTYLMTLPDFAGATEI